MPRPRIIEDEDLLRAAREVLLERGAGATTAEVARRAGVSEGTVFKRFKTKAELFRAALEPGRPEWLISLKETVGSGDALANVRKAFIEAVEFFVVVAPLVTLAWSQPNESGLPDVFDVDDPPPLRALRELTAYFETEMAAGRIPRRDPDTLARVFISTAERHVLFETLERHVGRASPSPESLADDFVRLVWPDAQS